MGEREGTQSIHKESRKQRQANVKTCAAVELIEGHGDHRVKVNNANKASPTAMQTSGSRA
jgi:hypothetical protein